MLSIYQLACHRMRRKNNYILSIGYRNIQDGFIHLAFLYSLKNANDVSSQSVPERESR